MLGRTVSNSHFLVFGLYMPGGTVTISRFSFVFIYARKDGLILMCSRSFEFLSSSFSFL